MNSDWTHSEIAPQAVLDFSGNVPNSGAICALLTPALKQKLREIESGEVLEVRVDDPSAQADIVAWSRLAGHSVLAMFTDGPQRLRFYLRKK